MDMIPPLRVWIISGPPEFFFMPSRIAAKLW
jgi:hypothetical protein